MANQLTPDEIKNINKALEDRIIAAVEDNSKWKSVLPDLMNAEVFVVAQVSDKTDANGKKLLNILSMKNKEGQMCIPFFTSPNKMAVLATPERKSFNCMKMKTIRLFEAVKGKAAMLNPGSHNCTKLFTPFEMNLLVMENRGENNK
ncbi:MAG: SseB family protein [Oscillospiraceae bacterium]|nr:SseB family protein [Oscillospiraceae bacterium]